MIFEDVMIDLETLGTSNQCPVISLGAVCFDIKTKTLGPTFYLCLDVKKQLDEIGRKVDADTIKWWMSQTDAAKRVFKEEGQDPSRVLTLFSNWLNQNTGQHRGRSKGHVWGNGSTFDISILEDFYSQLKLTVPWSYNRINDLRTFRRFNANGAPVPKSGVNHNALDDAISQAQFVLDHVDS